MNILVLCTGNSARSILLEALLTSRGAGRFRTFSAGSRPAGSVHPQALAILRAQGLPTRDLRSKSWDEFAAGPPMDAVVTVCASAAGEVCPVWPGAPVRAHWGVDDPAALPPVAWDSGFRAAFEILSRRAVALCEADDDVLQGPGLKPLLDRIGRIA